MGCDSSESRGGIEALAMVAGREERKLSDDWHASRLVWRSISSGASCPKSRSGNQHQKIRVNAEDGGRG